MAAPCAAEAKDVACRGVLPGKEISEMRRRHRDRHQNVGSIWIVAQG